MIVYFRVVDGTIGRGDYIRLMNTGKEYEVDEVGVLAPKPVEVRFRKSAAGFQSTHNHRVVLNH